MSQKTQTPVSGAAVSNASRRFMANFLRSGSGENNSPAVASTSRGSRPPPVEPSTSGVNDAMETNADPVAEDSSSSSSESEDSRENRMRRKRRKPRDECSNSEGHEEVADDEDDWSDVEDEDAEEYNPRWEQKFQFLLKGGYINDERRVRPFCEFCRVGIKCGLSHVRKHAKLAFHKEEAEKNFRKMLIDRACAGTGLATADAETLLSAYMGNAETARDRMEQLSDMIATFAKPDIPKKEGHCQCTKAADPSLPVTVHRLGRIERERLVRVLRREHFALIFEEHPDVEADKMLALAVRYVSDNGTFTTSEGVSKRVPVVVDEFLGLVSTHDGTSESLAENIDGLFAEYGIPWENCIGFSADTTSSEKGRNGGVVPLLENRHGYMLKVGFTPASFHSCAYQTLRECWEHEAVGDWVDITNAAENFIRDMSVYRMSTVTSCEAAGFQQFMSEPRLRVMRFLPTLWLSRHEVIEHVLKNWEPLKEYFTGEARASRHNSTAHRIAKHFSLGSPTKALLVFLYELFASLDMLNACFGSDMPFMIQKGVSTYLNKVELNFLGREAACDKYFPGDRKRSEGQVGCPSLTFEPTFKPAPPPYPPAAPRKGCTSPVSAPKSPTYTTASPNYSCTSPSYRCVSPTYPTYTFVSPKYTCASPTYSPCEPTVPTYDPRTPPYTDYNPATPHYDPTCTGRGASFDPKDVKLSIDVEVLLEKLDKDDPNLVWSVRDAAIKLSKSLASHIRKRIDVEKKTGIKCLDALIPKNLLEMKDVAKLMVSLASSLPDKVLRGGPSRQCWDYDWKVRKEVDLLVADCRIFMDEHSEEERENPMFPVWLWRWVRNATTIEEDEDQPDCQEKFVKKYPILGQVGCAALVYPYTTTSITQLFTSVNSVRREKVKYTMRDIEGFLLARQLAKRVQTGVKSLEDLDWVIEVVNLQS